MEDVPRKTHDIRHIILTTFDTLCEQPPHQKLAGAVFLRNLLTFYPPSDSYDAMGEHNNANLNHKNLHGILLPKPTHLQSISSFSNIYNQQDIINPSVHFLWCFKWSK